MSERWKPESNEIYYYISELLTIKVDCNKNVFTDNKRIYCGNCFKTEEAAEAAAEKVKALLLSLHDNGETLQDSIQDKQLPDWCKVGEYVFDSQYGYGIVANSSATYCNVKFCDFSAEYHPDLFSELKQARLRPYNADEMKALVGKVICTNDDKTFLVLVYSYNTVLFGDILHTAEDLILDRYKFQDGKPCGKFEHLENGEWVE